MSSDARPLGVFRKTPAKNRYVSNPPSHFNIKVFSEADVIIILKNTVNIVTPLGADVFNVVREYRLHNSVGGLLSYLFPSC